MNCGQSSPNVLSVAAGYAALKDSYIIIFMHKSLHAAY